MKMTCAILAGGKSTRMGQDKATIKIGEKALIRLVYDKVKEVFDDVLIISRLHNAIESIDAPVLKDIVPFGNSMTGIASALLYSETPYTLVVACDMPFLSTEAFKYMVKEATGEDIIIPKTKLGFEPLHAIYNKSCIAHLLRLIEQNRFKITGVLPFVSVKELKEHPCFYRTGNPVFTNINVMNDLSMVEAV
jgi:molybdopterin-guanine dinucleotide biosynthesis protein A